MCSGQNGDDEHVCAHQGGATQKRTSAADPLDKEEQEEQARDDLDNAKEARNQKVVLAGSNGGEYLWGIYGVLSNPIKHNMLEKLTVCERCVSSKLNTYCSC